ncbi:MAG: putative glycosyltransferase [Mucilaginibacter sp.]|nr:putative glycosyltransferase [Mucilaginibacter sp.]
MGIIDHSISGDHASDFKWVIKRAIDFLFSAMLLVFLMPVILIIATLIFSESRGNPIFSQKRVGKNGKLFTIYKIRTLYRHHFGLFQDQPDPYRVTPIGKYLRRSKLDELPQLFNILLGDMSFVGPRPFIPFEFDFDENLRTGRVLIKPGLTGVAQVSGNTKLGKSNIAWMDIWYVKNYSLGLDIKILIFTLTAIVKGENQYDDPFNLHNKLPVKSYTDL